MRHFWRSIPGWCSYTEILAEAVRDAPATPQGCGDTPPTQGVLRFVEVGCWKGRSTAFLGVEIVNSGKAIELWCVDTWEGAADEPLQRNDPSCRAGTLFAEFLANTAPLGAIVQPWREASPGAAARFADTSLDFVMIDADHEEAAVAADIRGWLPKVKPGGLLAGDDYGYAGVAAAVRALLPGAAVRRVGASQHWLWRIE